MTFFGEVALQELAFDDSREIWTFLSASQGLGNMPIPIAPRILSDMSASNAVKLLPRPFETLHFLDP